MTLLLDNVKVNTATTGTGTVTLGTAVDATYQTFAQAGAGDGLVYRYRIDDGDAWEIGTGTYTASGTTLSRTVIRSTNSDTALNLSGSATVSVVASQLDIPPTDAKYVVSAASSRLSNELIIPNLAASADVAGAQGGGLEEEYDTASTGLTWTPSDPSTATSNASGSLSHLYLVSGDTTNRYGMRAYTPGAPFSARVKVGVSSVTGTLFGMVIWDSGATDGLMIAVLAGNLLRAYTYDTGSFTQRYSLTYSNNVDVYLRADYNGSDTITFYYSANGLIWYLIGTSSKTFTAAEIGYRLSGNGTVGVSDWIRTDA